MCVLMCTQYTCPPHQPSLLFEVKKAPRVTLQTVFLLAGGTVGALVSIEPASSANTPRAVPGPHANDEHCAGALLAALRAVTPGRLAALRRGLDEAAPLLRYASHEDRQRAGAAGRSIAGGATPPPGDAFEALLAVVEEAVRIDNGEG